MKIEKRELLITGIVFLVLSIAFVILQGSSYTLKVNTNATSDDVDQYQVLIEQDHEIIKLTDKSLENGTLSLDIQSVSKGRGYIDVYGPDGLEYAEVVYVHYFGVITVDSYFGRACKIKCVS
ncbi:MAG: hypothetical protein IJV39_05370 [Ruminococcus sp.]|nr:hypothetical protein [Ruminococcus sp.]